MGDYYPEFNFSGRYQTYTNGTAWANREAWKYEPALSAQKRHDRLAAIHHAFTLAMGKFAHHPMPLAH